MPFTTNKSTKAQTAKPEVKKVDSTSTKNHSNPKNKKKRVIGNINTTGYDKLRPFTYSTDSAKHWFEVKKRTTIRC